MTEIARGEIRVEVDDEKALADLARIDAEFERAMDNIDRRDATVDLDANVKGLKKDLKEAERAVSEYERRIAKQQNAGAKKSMEKKLALLKQEEAQRKKLLDQGEKELKQEKDRVTGLEREEKVKRAIEKRDASVARAREQQSRREAANMRAEEQQLRKINAFRARMAKQEAREMASAHSDALRMQRDQEAHLAFMDKERRAVPILARQYNDLTQKIDKLSVARRKVRRDERATSMVDFKVDEARQQLRNIEDRLQRSGLSIDVPVRLSGHVLGERIREIRNERGVVSAGQALGMALGRDIGLGIGRAISVRSVGRSGLSLLGNIGQKLGNLSNMTVRLGPFTATIRQAVTGTALLAPLVIDLVGSLGALVGTVGSAALGLGALGTAIIGGAIPAAIGFFTVLKPVVGEIKNAMTASKGYSDAVLKYGRNSDQAKTKLEQFNHVMRGQSDATRKTFLAAGDLSKRWAEITKPSRASAFRVMGEGLKFAADNAGFFGRRTNESFAVAERGVTRWIKALGSRDGRQVLGEMMDNFNASLGPALDGLGNLAAYLGRVGAVASRFLPDMAQDFRQWTKELLRTTDNTGDFEGKIRRTIESLKSVGRFATSAGRLIKTALGGGVESGTKLFDDMAGAMDRWRRALSTTEGQQNLGQFFERSASGAQSLFAVLGPLAGTFVRWAAALAPVVQAFTSVLGPMAGFVANITRMVALQGPVQALIATLGVLWGIGKLTAATRAVQGFTASLAGMARVQKSVATTAAATTAVGAAAGGLGRGAPLVMPPSVVRNTSMVASNMGRGAKAAGLLRGGLTAVGGALGIANPLFGAAALGVAAVATGFYFLNKRSHEAEKAFREAGDATTRTETAYRQTASTLADSASANERATLSVKGARAALKDAKKGTDEYRLAQLDLQDAQRYAVQTQNNFNHQKREQVRLADEQIDRSAKELTAFERANGGQIRGLKGRLAAMEPWTRGSINGLRLQRELAALEGQRAQLTNNLAAAQNRQAAVSANQARALQGMTVVAGQAEQKLGALARRSKSAAVKIALKFDAPQDVGRVAAQASSALRSGVPTRIVTKIVADSSNADQAVRRIRAVKIQDKKLSILQNGGQSTLNWLQRITGHKFTRKQQQIIQNGGPAVLGVLHEIYGIRIPPKIVTAIANTSAAQAALGALRSAASVPIVQQVITSVTKVKGRARGRGPEEGAEAALVGEGGGPEIIANRRDRTVAVVSEPTFLALDRDDFVIPTEPKFAGRGRMLMERFAEQAGIPSFRKGKAPLKPKYTAGKGKAVSRLEGVQSYGYWTKREEHRNREISIARSQVREPDSFIKQTGKDSEGNPIYSIDESAIGTYTRALQHVKDLVDSLIKPGGILDSLQSAAARAYSQIAKYITNRQTNIDVLDSTMKRNKRLFGSKDEDTKQAAHKRFDKAKQMRDAEKNLIADAKGERGRIKEDQTDAAYRRQEYGVDSGDLGYDIGRIRGDAIKDRNSSNPTPKTPEAPEVDTTVPLPQQMFILNDARGALLRDFGSNFASVTSRAASSLASPGIAGASAAGNASVRAFGGASRVAGGSGGISGAGATGGGDKIVNVVNNYQMQPEDPHTWSRSLEYELQAAI